MSLETIDHISIGKERAISYFQSKENYLNLLEIFLREIQEVEDAFIELAQMKDLNTVTGVWLDYLGSILGEERDGLGDDVYRANLKLRVAINTSDGTTPVLQEILRTYTESDFIRFAQGVLSYGQVIFNGTSNATRNLYELVQDIIPVTTRVILLQNTDENCFFPAWETEIANLDAFFLEDGVGGKSLFELTLTETAAPSPFFVTLDGELSGVDQDTGGDHFFEWEDNPTTQLLFTDYVGLELNVGEPLELLTSGSNIENTRLFPWEINENSFYEEGYPQWLIDALEVYGDIETIEELFVDLSEIPPNLPDK